MDEHTSHAVRGGDVDIYLELGGLDVQQRAMLKRRLRAGLEEDLDLPVDLVVQERGAPLKAVSVVAKGEGVRIGGGGPSVRFACGLLRRPATRDGN